VQGVLRIRTTKVLQKLYKIPYLEADITKRSSEWLRHVIRMDQAIVNMNERGRSVETPTEMAGRRRE
jgi:hypothetical protein